MSAPNFHMASFVGGAIHIEQLAGGAAVGLAVGDHRIVLSRDDFRTLGFKVARTLMEGERQQDGAANPNVVLFPQRKRR